MKKLSILLEIKVNNGGRKSSQFRNSIKQRTETNVELRSRIESLFRKTILTCSIAVVSRDAGT